MEMIQSGIHLFWICVYDAADKLRENMVCFLPLQHLERVLYIRAEQEQLVYQLLVSNS